MLATFINDVCITSSILGPTAIERFCELVQFFDIILIPHAHQPRRTYLDVSVRILFWDYIISQGSRDTTSEIFLDLHHSVDHIYIAQSCWGFDCMIKVTWVDSSATHALVNLQFSNMVSTALPWYCIGELLRYILVFIIITTRLVCVRVTISQTWDRFFWWSLWDPAVFLLVPIYHFLWNCVVFTMHCWPRNLIFYFIFRIWVFRIKELLYHIIHRIVDWFNLESFVCTIIWKVTQNRLI